MIEWFITKKIATLLMGFIGLDREKALRISKWIIITIAVLIVLIVASFTFKSCYTEYKINQTQKVLDKFNEKQTKIEIQAEQNETIVTEKEKQVVIAKEKAKASTEAIDEIKYIEGVSDSESVEIFCKFLKSQGRQNNVCPQ